MLSQLRRVGGSSLIGVHRGRCEASRFPDNPACTTLFCSVVQTSSVLSTIYVRYPGQIYHDDEDGLAPIVSTCRPANTKLYSGNNEEESQKTPLAAVAVTLSCSLCLWCHPKPMVEANSNSVPFAPSFSLETMINQPSHRAPLPRLPPARLETENQSSPPLALEKNSPIQND